MNNNKTLAYAKDLRRAMTDAEARLWYHLRAHRFFGLKFKRQKPLGPYIVDFVCMEHRLVVELDGSQHVEGARYDEARDAWLASQGFKVLRFWNDEALRGTEAVLESIRLAVSPDTLSPSPSPASGRGEKKNHASRL
jgi:very-short-patch-repair endonuclease